MKKQIKDQRIKIGQIGEQFSVQFLESNNYHVKEINWRCKIGEIDIIAYEKDILVFLEVRTRRDTGKFGTPQESINYTKQHKVRSASQVYLMTNNKLNGKIRFDAICILLNKKGDTLLSLDHIKNAF
ncbi:YraN family protein [Chengkuizengella sediminis]|uniref:YraN family protein n=1 Tax=Chengkuizengella sediminis TaxID=1885917 RepID=UPI001389C01C|nr:YraN family protein [Chengkuizengella sediminis]NDI33407.1 YraN family protein [Chengkuizengella sediminis]